MLTEQLFENSDNDIKLLIEIDGSPAPFLSAGTSKIDMVINGTLISSTTGDITWDDAGHIIIKAREEYTDIPYNAKFPVSIKVYDATYTRGQYVVHPKHEESNLKVEVIKEL